MRMGEKDSVRRVRVLVIFYKWLKIPKCINIDTRYRIGGCGFAIVCVFLLLFILC
jgi:hypothetical protein